MTKSDPVFTYDRVFKRVMRNPEICREILHRLIPGIDTSDFTYIESEHEIIIHAAHKSIRLDVSVSDQEKKVDMEMFRYKFNVEKHLRLNGSMMDAELPTGQTPDRMPGTIIIFFMTYDPFGIGLPVYHIRNRIDELSGYGYNDGREAIIVTNTEIELADEELKPVIHLLMNDDFMGYDDSLSIMVQHEINQALLDPEVKKMIMNEKWYEQIREEHLRRQAYEEVHEEVAQEVTEKVTKEVTEKVTQEVTDKVTQEVTQKMTRNGIMNLISVLKKQMSSDADIFAFVRQVYPGNDQLIHLLMQ